MSIEGSLDILWENREQPAATPRYRLLFARYQGFRGGAQPAKHIVGPEGLESYLVEIGFTVPDARRWIKQLHEGDRSISIPNVIMPPEHMAPYEYQAS